VHVYMDTANRNIADTCETTENGQCPETSSLAYFPLKMKATLVRSVFVRPYTLIISDFYEIQ